MNRTKDERIVVLVRARTPVGSVGGGLSESPAHEPSARTLAAVRRSQIFPPGGVTIETQPDRSVGSWSNGRGISCRMATDERGSGVRA